jgi:hypothetical protein
MKKLHRTVPDVPQEIADRGTEIIERHFQAYGVKRASELPEEGRVHLYREMQQFFAAELPHGAAARATRGGIAGWWERLKAGLRGD